MTCREFTIPSVDISPFLADSSSPAAETVVSEIRNACMTSGFFQITGHGISSELQDTVIAAAKAFFSLSTAEKMKFAGTIGRGYEVIGAQALDPTTKPDLKEGYFIGREIPNRSPPYRAFEHPNVWPTSVIPDSHFRDPLLAYHTALSDLALKVLTILSRGLTSLTPALLADFCNEPVASVRLLHYPPHPTAANGDDDASSIVGAGAHTDFGAITLLFQDGQSGLQVLDRSTQSWIAVEPNRDAYVVNVGDMLDWWTGGRYKSTVHRVVNTSGSDRYSIPFFFDGNLDFVVRPLDEPAAEGVTVGRHLAAKYEEIYL
ncbi:Clavaminate synthase-like protein [Aspergillus heterothallicus]